MINRYSIDKNCMSLDPKGDWVEWAEVRETWVLYCEVRADVLELRKSLFRLEESFANILKKGVNDA